MNALIFFIKYTGYNSICIVYNYYNVNNTQFSDIYISATCSNIPVWKPANLQYLNLKFSHHIRSYLIEWY